ncbi:MAG: hypothetical protein A2268_11790 [Candidatus Raymondbacteria bacterium RifOxyA12_full_50_37]|uniref:Pilus assembly protein PilE n=1 Tax=Candidatus Raymondbacteria bacterium RIFOXYD12_FULL_49_13 TaxID=1817890 RepID=A0A1F7FLU6_UNCRA|nr:MAG: hypothetical protein A2268_11790 [Candidatus Raymondbacteria bacterium RifOxyA12_full_50_37]OGJ98729.1 MAG: hypothetical protein A2453_08255 [Candidatus Raymondbacteria bacterium RIFOXYC2_FULL_50_21]OGJ99179.1 MAG: hypothetical protein A2350_17975 [Candidatus Raymondbacteria bacterium RifOxyB12_full_50_8]OGK07447.1 MAG: hypothetical protein A2519_11150 [Candidatus Raymondbacteria bacterium RIFOXYD12_FULL_49_13]OGK07814.1 MAG: hypothetical protein A2487_00175 [Candidatus Raymondbacteria 
MKKKWVEKLKDQRGFTLTELMVVIVIIGVLATWSIPKFMGTIAKAKLSEYKLVLEHLVSLEEIYFQEHDGYGATFQDINFDVPDSKYFEYSLQADSTGFMAIATVKIEVRGPGRTRMKGKSVSIDHTNTHGGDDALRKLTNW